MLASHHWHDEPPSRLKSRPIDANYAAKGRSAPCAGACRLPVPDRHLAVGKCDAEVISNPHCAIYSRLGVFR